MSISAPTTRCEYLPDHLYHADREHVASSQLKVLARSASEYHARFVDGSMPWGVETNKAMDIGSIAHAITLQGKPFQSLCAVYPASCLKTNGDINGKPAAKFAAEQREAGVPYCLKQGDADRCKEFVIRLRSHEQLTAILEGPRTMAEHAILWSNEGLRLRCKPDFLVVSASGAHAFDLKCTGFCAPQAFRRQIKSQRYWLQQACYRDGIATHFGLPLDAVEFRFVAANPEPPFQIFFHHLSDYAAGEADARYWELLSELRYRQDSDDWLDTNADQDNEISLSQYDWEG